MDKSKAKAIVDREIGGLMQAFGVCHWHICISYDQKDLQGDDEAASTHATIKIYPAYDQAYISFNVGAIDGDDELLAALRHELAHIVLAPFDLYRNHATRHVRAGTTEERQYDAIWEFAVEQAVLNLSRAIEGHAGKAPKSRRK